MIQMEIKKEVIERVNSVLAGVKDGANTAISNAFNSGLLTVRSQASKEIRAVYDISREDLKSGSLIRERKSNKGSLIGEIIFLGAKIPLYKFNVSPEIPNTGEIVKAKQMIDSALVPFPHAFIAEMKNNANDHTGMFERSGKSRLPIEEYMGSSVPQMVNNPTVSAKLEKAAQATVNKRIEDEISRVLNRYGGKK